MTTIYGVEVGNWYRTPAGRLFEVVALDAETIGIQYEDGDLDEIEPAAWLEMEPVLSAVPASVPDEFDLDDGFAELDRQTLYDVLGTLEFTD